MNALWTIVSSITSSASSSPHTVTSPEYRLPTTIGTLQPYLDCARTIKMPGDVVACRIEQTILNIPSLFFTWVPRSVVQPDFIRALQTSYRTFFDLVFRDSQPGAQTAISIHPLLGIKLQIQLPVLLQECQRFLETNGNYDHYSIYIAQGGIQADPWLWTTEIDKIIPRSRIRIHYQERLAHHHQASAYALLDIEAENGLSALLQDFETVLQTPPQPDKKAIEGLKSIAESIVQNEFYYGTFTFSDAQKNEMQTLIMQGHIERKDIQTILNSLEISYQAREKGLRSLLALSGFLLSLQPSSGVVA